MKFKYSNVSIIIDILTIQIPPNQYSKVALLQKTAMLTSEAGMKIYIGGLAGPLEKITSEDLQKLFGSMGEIEFIDLQKDPYTEKCKLIR
jgi:RNA recognition motif-containing protein